MERSFFQKLKRYRTPVRSLGEYAAREYGDLLQIDIDLYEGLSLFEPLSIGPQRELNRDIYDFIDSKIYYVPLKRPVSLRFCRSTLSAEGEAMVRAAIKKHYDLILLDKGLDLKLNAIKISALSLIGIFLLGAWFAAQLWSNQPIFIEILSIAGTFSLWEAVDLYLLERKALKVEKWNAAQAALSEVVFIPDAK